MLPTVPDRQSLTLLPQNVLRGVDLARVIPDRSMLFYQYAKATADIQAASADIDKFARVLVARNMGISLQAFQPLLDLELAEIAVQHPTKIRDDLHCDLQRLKKALADKFKAVLEHLIEQKQIGLIQWFAKDVCRYSYYTAEHKDAVRRKYRSGRNDIIEKERTHFHLCHVHDVIDARVLSAVSREVRGMVMPGRVRRIIQAMPTWLQPHGRIVIGKEIRNRVFEVGRSTEMIREVVWRGDPALVVGPYVLAGWSDGEK